MEKEEKVEKKESKKEVKKGRKHRIWLTILIIALLITSACGGYLVGASNIANKVGEQKAQEAEEGPVKEDSNGLEISDAIKEKLERFILVGSYYDATGANTTLNHFMKGTKELPKEVKILMTRNTIYREGNYRGNVTLSAEDANKLSGEKPDNGEIVDIFTKDEFNKVYKRLFGEDSKYNFEDIKDIGCPRPMAINETTGEMYLFHRCGGTSMISYNNTITSYESDTDYYYVHEKIEKNDSYTGESEENQIVWKFDKNLKFISTEKE